MTSAGICFLVRAAALFALAGDWVEASNASWECGYGGTCIDRGLFGATVTVELVLVAAEFVVATAWWARFLWRQRLSPELDDWWALLMVRLPWTVMAGCLVSVLAVTGWRLLA
ncbi:hypothetical protein [Streptomyces sp. HPF1205]|uniref:hypothetical protein n=1 Tax=Streptomyces sp. HPF1205 TaxID=2873262 RepID=UPI001CEC43FC|nr:hypothetical protein [Streptomyces sp. HPF1205]